MKHPNMTAQKDSRSLTNCEVNLTEMSYEFRTSLNTILMSVELLETQKASGKDTGSTRYLQQIRSAVDKMNDVLDERLDLHSTASSCT
ncbi:MAG: histidine kinase dimerization/phospho-acceptor domain-containing protein [Geitlerinemataceae cyanobacterium]